MMSWLKALLHSLALRSRDVPPPRASASAVILTVALLIAVWLGTDWLRSGPAPVFSTYALQGVAWLVLAGLAIAAVLARRSLPPTSLGATLPFLALATALGLGLSYVIDTWLRGIWLFVATMVTVVYCIAVVSRGLHIVTARPQPLAVMLAIVVAGVFHWGMERLYVPTSLWATAEEAEEQSYEESWDRAEPLLFSQAERVAASSAHVRRGDPATVDVFFIGFAGYGEQRVFAEEIELASSVVAERYGAGDRRLLLLNDRRDLEGAPLATLSTLRRALRDVAARMDLEQDILFLALSSHGSDDWSLSVSNGALPLTDLSSTQLAALLEESGIKWRIIAISACYAGGFIDALRNPQTIVVAAAAPDRTSFGCSDDRDLTYFGEAFYRDSLPHAASLRDAFDTARHRIAERERLEQVDELSDPRAWFGEALERKLAPLELARRHDGRAPVSN